MKEKFVGKDKPVQEDLFALNSKTKDQQKNKIEVNRESLVMLEKSLDSIRALEGFPHGLDSHILSISLPPYFTACPNPYLEEFVQQSTTEDSAGITSQPLSIDIAAGKNDPLYFAHYYSTKVPPDAIIPYIMHYTEPGQIVFDGFCGTGMTGVAAQLCEDPYRPSCRGGKPGRRKAILIDLCPAATFIAAGTNALTKLIPYLDEIEEMIGKVEEKHASILSTRHVGWPRGTTNPAKRVNADDLRDPFLGKIEYVVWSDVFFCSECGAEIIYWNLVFRGPRQPLPKSAPCKECGAEQSIKTLERSWVTKYDHELGKSVRQAKQVPVLINYSVGKKRFEKLPDEKDLDLLASLEAAPVEDALPLISMPKGFNTEQPLKSHGFSHVHHFFTRRNLILLAEMWHRILETTDPIKRMAGLYLLTGSVQRVCRLNRYMPNHDRHVGPLSGTLYVSQLTAEIPATNYAYARIKDLRRCASAPTSGGGIRISTQSATVLKNIPDSSVDYIFTDPPFGGNLNYSELNILVEAWIGVQSDAEPEAVVNQVQAKTLVDYQKLKNLKCIQPKKSYY